MQRPVILIVEDEPDIRMLAAETFEDQGYEVLEASTGAEALAILRGLYAISALFTDIQMPGSPDGLGLAMQARVMFPDCAIVVVSGRILPRADEMALGARYIRKPYRTAEVMRVIDELRAA